MTRMKTIMTRMKTIMTRMKTIMTRMKTIMMKKTSIMTRMKTIMMKMKSIMTRTKTIMMKMKSIMTRTMNTATMKKTAMMMRKKVVCALIWKQTRYDFIAALDNPLPGLNRVKLRWAFNDYQHDEIESNGEVATAFDNEEVEGRVEFLHNPIGNWSGVVGFHYRHKDFSAVGAESFVLPSKLESVGVFILERTDIGQWHIDLGARFEHQDSSAETGLENNYDLFSASGGVNWNYAPGYQFGLSVSHSERGAVD